MRESVPTALATSLTSAPVLSQMAEKELMLDILCARKALAASLESSEDHELIVRIFSLRKFRKEIKMRECQLGRT